MSQYACALAMARWSMSKRYLRGIKWLMALLYAERGPSYQRLMIHRLQSLLLSADIIRSARVRD